MWWKVGVIVALLIIGVPYVYILAKAWTAGKFKATQFLITNEKEKLKNGKKEK